MLKKIVERNLRRQREMMLGQVVAIRGLMQLLMKHRNTGQIWTPEELRQIRAHLRTLTYLFPILVVFIVPGGIFLIPVLAEVLDRRTQRNR
jgi:hypothetical protein